ncbi:hypothetical protein BH23CHL5_BH23CHL5_07910 [soil metagenome]
MKRWFRVQQIGIVSRPDDPGGNDCEFFDPFVESVIEIDPRWKSGLTGIEEFSHLVVLFYLDRAQRRRASGPLRAAEDGPMQSLVGFFSTRTPKRPNPLGIACPRLVSREGRRLTVIGMDAWDGTPVIDIKGYYPRDELRSDAAVPTWLSELWNKHDLERASDLHTVDGGKTTQTED